MVHLRSIAQNDDIFDQVLWQRVRRRDRTALPALLAELPKDRTGYWWQLGRDFWSDEMTEALESALGQRTSSASSADEADSEGGPDWILSEMVMNLPAGRAETILLRHWPALQDSSYYITAALFFASPPLLDAVAEAVKQNIAPKNLFRHLSMRAGRVRGRNGARSGFFQIKQIEAIIPYFDYLSDSEIHELWDVCNKHGWYNLRRQYLDSRLSGQWRDCEFVTEADALKQLDERLKGPAQWIDRWVDRCVEVGWKLDQVLQLVARWCAEKKTPAALEVLVSALLHAGTRKHVSLLDIDGIFPADEASAIRIDTTFAVMRRTAGMS